MDWIAGRSVGSAGRSCTATSTGIGRLLAIEDALERFEVRRGVLGCVGEHQLVRALDDIRAYCAQLAAHGTRQHLQAASALQVIHKVESLGDRRPDDNDAVV